MAWSDNVTDKALEITGSKSKRLWVAERFGTGKSYSPMRRLWTLLESASSEAGHG